MVKVKVNRISLGGINSNNNSNISRRGGINIQGIGLGEGIRVMKGEFLLFSFLCFSLEGFGFSCA